MRRYLVLYVTVFVVLGLAIATVARQEARESAPPVPSTYILGPEGFRAAWRLLEVSGVRVERHVATFDELPAGRGHLLVVAAPRSREVEELEAASLAAWIRSGNTLLWLTALGDPLTYAGPLEGWDQAVAAARRHEGELLRVLDAPLAPRGDEASRLERRLAVAVDTAFTRDMRELWAGPSQSMELGSRLWVPVAGTRAGAALYVRSMGQGRVWLAPTPHLLDNTGLSRADNVIFLRNLVGREVRGGWVLFDEYHHGWSPSPLVAVLDSIVFRVVVGQGLLLFVLYLWARTRRFGPPVPLVRDPRRPALEYLQAMARLLHRAGRSRETARGLAEDFRGTLQARLAVPAGTGPEPLRVLLERRTGENWEDLASLLDRAEKGRVRRPRTLLELAREIRRAENRLMERRPPGRG